MTLRPYQTEIAQKACDLLNNGGIAYLAMEVRTGKTLTALHAADLYGAKKVLFLTKKKAKLSIEKDWIDLYPDFQLRIDNYEQIHNIIYDSDLIIVDEAHCLGQYPKPAERTKKLKELCKGKPIIFLSGTPTPESYSQVYHQLWVSSFSPFNAYSSFYKWAKDFVKVQVKYYYGRQNNDYSQADKEKIDKSTSHLFLTYTQSQAGFECQIEENILKVRMSDKTYWLAEKLITERLHIGKHGEQVIADTEVKLMQKLQQIYSGSVIDDLIGEPICFDRSKVELIAEKFRGKKIAIFYKFRGEYDMIRKFFKTTNSPEMFNNSQDLVFASQILSGREGINLSTADALIMFNIDFSSVSYWQARARMQTKDRVAPCKLYWVFAEGGIEEKIYERVLAKKDYTISYFRNDYKRQGAIY